MLEPEFQCPRTRSLRTFAVMDESLSTYVMNSCSDHPVEKMEQNPREEKTDPHDRVSEPQEETNPPQNPPDKQEDERDSEHPLQPGRGKNFLYKAELTKAARQQAGDHQGARNQLRKPSQANHPARGHGSKPNQTRHPRPREVAKPKTPTRKNREIKQNHGLKCHLAFLSFIAKFLPNALTASNDTLCTFFSEGPSTSCGHCCSSDVAENVSETLT